jgi:hypothetical protein
MVTESEAIGRHREYFLQTGRQIWEQEKSLTFSAGPLMATRSDKDAINEKIRRIRALAELERAQINQALDSDKKSFVAKLQPDLSPSEFMMKLGEASIPSDSEVLGTNTADELAELMACAVLYPSTLAEFPSTFDLPAFATIVDPVAFSNIQNLFDPEKALLLTDAIVERTQYLANRALQLGVIEHSHEDRFLITPNKKRKLLAILEKFDEVQ